MSSLFLATCPQGQQRGHFYPLHDAKTWGPPDLLLDEHFQRVMGMRTSGSLHCGLAWCCVSQIGKTLLGTGPIGGRLNACFTHKLTYTFTDITKALTDLWE